VTTFNARVIFPPHAADDAAKVDALAAAMDANGWEGRPVLAVRIGGSTSEVQALTGSHRIAAARRAGVGVEVLLVELDGSETYADRYGDAVSVAEALTERGIDDEQRLVILQASGIDDAATALMAAEVAANG